MSQQPAIITNEEVANALKNQRYREESELKEQILESALTLLINVLNERNAPTYKELEDDEYSLGRSDWYYFNLLHELWHSALNFHLFLNGKPRLDKIELSKPLPKNHIGYQFHSHYFPPNKDRKFEEERDRKEFLKMRAKLEKQAKEPPQEDLPF